MVVSSLRSARFAAGVAIGYVDCLLAICKLGNGVEEQSDPAAAGQFRITGFPFDPMKIRIFFRSNFPTVVAALLTHERDRERHSGRVVKLR